MKSSKWLWRAVVIGSIVSTALCAFGFVYAVNQILFPNPVVSNEPGLPASEQKKPDVLADREQLRIVALGDSLTAGTGDLTGKGYVGQLRDKLEKQAGKPVFVYNNFAIPGYRTTDLLKDLDAKKEISQAIAESDIVLLTIGGNDLFEGGQGILDQSQGFSAKAAADRMPEALKRLEQVLSIVAKANPKAIVYYVGLYHPFLDLDETREGSLVVQKWNTSAFEMANRYPNVVVVPTYDLFELNLTKYLYSDHFHPNQDGYERIAERIAQILK
ncbi:GDSL-type esterase/lipase family protein [Paenibacillus hamazuiensis]|uniref:GDSL-type esterase/lipase family protein n=1 Tax=Paenibacillus hamazuiensis TaxID=2936508 RepID=UPI00200EEE69|nr:GDSL-type esterase/lipase family protein [Paenibacillus hamazuiensis]